MQAMHYDATAAARLDLALELYFNGTVATLEEGEQEAALLFDDLARYASAYDADVATLEATQ